MDRRRAMRTAGPRSPEAAGSSLSSRADTVSPRVHNMGRRGTCIRKLRKSREAREGEHVSFGLAGILVDYW